MGLLLFSGGALPFQIEQADLAYYPDTLLLSARIDYRLSEEVKGALRQGVPITTLLEVRLMGPLWPIWREQLAFRLEFLPLSGLYRVVDLESGIQRSFPRLEEATRALGQLEEKAFSLSERRFRESRGVELRVWLDRSQLPWSLWLKTLFDPKWHLSSPVYRWSKPS